MMHPRWLHVSPLTVKLLFLAFLLALVLAIVANPTNALAQPQLGELFELQVGESTTIAGEGLVVRFDKTASDSRCPRDAVCIWPGDATVLLGARIEGVGETEFELHSNRELGEYSHRLGIYEIRLYEVSPYPEDRTPIDPEDYVVSLRVFSVGSPNAGDSWSVLKARYR